MPQIEIAQAAMVAALAQARGTSLRGVEGILGVAPGALHKALSRGPLPRAGAQHATGAARLTAEAVADALGVPVEVLLGDPVELRAKPPG